MTLNKVSLIGNLGRDPEIHRTEGGKIVANMRLATSESWKDKDTGERKEQVEWHSVVIFNENLARIVEQYSRKGSKLYVEGSLRTRKWTDKDGVERYSTEVVLSAFNGTVKLLDKAERPAPEADSYGTTRTREGAGGAPSTGSGAAPRGNYDLDDDIPF